jgi:hypothetical protein
VNRTYRPCAFGGATRTIFHVTSAIGTPASSTPKEAAAHHPRQRKQPLHHARQRKQPHVIHAKGSSRSCARSKTTIDSAGAAESIVVLHRFHRLTLRCPAAASDWVLIGFQVLRTRVRVIPCPSFSTHPSCAIHMRHAKSAEREGAPCRAHPTLSHWRVLSRQPTTNPLTHEAERSRLPSRRPARLVRLSLMLSVDESADEGDSQRVRPE